MRLSGFERHFCYTSVKKRPLAKYKYSNLFQKKQLKTTLQNISTALMNKIACAGKYTVFLWFVFHFWITPLHAQFNVNRNAFLSSNRCWTLTPDMPNQIGSIWYTQQLNLTQNFDITVSLFFGCNPNGSDGIIFALQPIGTDAGGSSGGTGIGGVAPSLDVEFDTYKNVNYNDPGYCYIGLTRDGDLNHNHTQNTLDGPWSVSKVPVQPPPNFRDCKFHDVRFTWDATLKYFTVYWECRKIFSHTEDFVATIFNGKPNVFWGFTSSSGAISNEQKMCLKYASLIDNAVDTVLCQGQSIQLNAASATTYSWSPAKGLSSTSIQNPIANPDTTTKYTIKVTDACGLKYVDTVTVRIGGKPFALNLGRDTTLCTGQTLQLNPKLSGASYIWENRPSMYPNKSTDSVYLIDHAGKYYVDVMKNHCSARDSLVVKYISPPIVDLGGSAILCEGKKKILTVKADSATYIWRDGSHQNNFVITQAGMYAVSVTNLCATVTDSFVADYQQCHKIFIPNTFSPNGDGVNDRWQIFGGDDISKIISVSVFNRWGGILYEGSNLDPFSLDGQWDGKNVPNGSYTYYVTVGYTDGEVETFSGSVNVAR